MSNAVPFEATRQVRDACLCLHARRAARRLARRFDEALAPVELTNGQFSLLMALNQPAPCAMGPVARLLAMDRTTLTAALKPLERRGWVASGPDPDDRRNRRLSLTDEGRRRLAQALPIWRDTHAAVEAELAAYDLAALRASLLAIA